MAEKATPKRPSAPQKRRSQTRRALSHFSSRPKAEKDGVRFYSMHDLHEKKAGRSVAKTTTNLARLPGFFLFAFSVIATCMFVIRTVDAASYQGPTIAPPGGNIPVTIWNRMATTGTQTNAAIDIDPGNSGPGAWYVGLNVGSETTHIPEGDGLVRFWVADDEGGEVIQVRRGNGRYPFSVGAGGGITMLGEMQMGSIDHSLGPTAGGQNLIYAVTNYAQAHSSDGLLRLQTFTSPNTWTDRFTVNRDGNVTASGTVTAAGFATTGGLTVGGDLTAVGDIKSNACFGSTVVGLTPAFHHGSVSNVGSYQSANALCAAAFAGSHVCTVQEVLESIKCAVPADPIMNLAGQYGWINGGPPGDPAKEANDCRAWTNNTAATFGRVWQFNAAGGVGTLTGCNALGGAKFTCCK